MSTSANNVGNTSSEMALRQVERRMFFDCFVCTNNARLFRYALYLCGGHRWDAEDVLQESYCKMWAHAQRHDVDVTTEKYLAFARRVVFNTFVGRWRDRKRARALFDELCWNCTEESPDDSAAQFEARARILEALRQLPPRHQEVLFLSDVCGWRAGSIGEELGLAEGTVRNYLTIARNRMNAALADPT